MGFAIGPNAYTGDLAKFYPDPSNTRASVQLNYRKHFNNFFIWRSHLTTHWVTGSGTLNETLNSPTTDFTIVSPELATGFEYNFLPFRTSWKSREKMTPYIFGTLGVSYQRYVDRPDINTTGEFPSHFSAVLPVGFGLKYKISRFWNFQIEWSSSYHLSDNLEGIRKYDDPAQVPYNTSNMDMIHHLSFGFVYNRVSVKCPSRSFPKL
ncbi:hypothetical protein GCM10023331_26390 [Algivirga pacifica]|uniref:DUF6089 domain-containing protein n=2 Tax=Algivirga pacifica TaxID=1162670 RepID=A0ABP9DCE1_9BACT